MQLRMDRSEKKGFFKKKYILTAQLVLSDEEKDLLKRHKLQDWLLFDAAEEWGPPHIWRLEAGGYINKGSDFTCDTVGDLSVLENTLQENCRALAKTLKNLDGAFDGGPRTVSFDDD